MERRIVFSEKNIKRGISENFRQVIEEIMAIKRSVKTVLIVAAVIVAAVIVSGSIAAWYLLAPNTMVKERSAPYYIYIHHGSTIEDITGPLKNDEILKNPGTFTMVTKVTKSDRLFKPGRYKIEEGMNNYQLLQKIRNGLQDPVRFTFNNINYPEDFCGVAGAAFQFDSIGLMEVIQDQDFLDSLGTSPEMLLGCFLPNTYEIYWTTTPQGLVARMLKEAEKFWSGERTLMLKKSGFTRDEVLILASIIQKESNHREELSRIAGVYINRLHTGMKLQADPTVKYANGDLSIRRVLYRHLDFPSPYNTYYVDGLPPGVICAPNPSAIDAVLQYEKHDYLYFCARPGYNSMHTFARTHAQHLQNRSKYQAWLRKEGIR